MPSRFFGVSVPPIPSDLVDQRFFDRAKDNAQFPQKLKNPYYIGDDPGLTQTSGWVDAWTSAPSVYAVAAINAADVVAAVSFARENSSRYRTTLHALGDPLSPA